MVKHHNANLSANESEKLTTLLVELLECNLCTSFALFTSLNIDVMHLIIMIYLYFTFVGAILLICDKIELQDDV